MSERDPILRMLDPFAKNEIGRLPKPTKAQTDEVRRDFKAGIRCGECGAWHHPNVVHLDYVGHAAMTKRLLEVDPRWSWEPLAFDENGLPRLDANGGLWIKLTVLGMTRLGYGCAEAKHTEGDRIKELVGDAIRNSAMRFGGALELWHKGDLYREDERPGAGAEGGEQERETEKPQPATGAAPKSRPAAAAAQSGALTAGQLRLLRGKLTAAGKDEIEFAGTLGFERLEEIPAASINDALAQAGA